MNENKECFFQSHSFPSLFIFVYVSCCYELTLAVTLTDSGLSHHQFFAQFTLQRLYVQPFRPPGGKIEATLWLC